MGFIKGAIFGAAAYAAVQYLTKKDLLTGRSKIEDLVDEAPVYIDKAKSYLKEAEQEFVEPEVRI
ncbi:MAG: YtxH domain-containing protein [Sphingobacteriales bacterium]|nr:MAG: YtxH domain-containing protein [Sphingobacteriales bacterium]